MKNFSQILLFSFVLLIVFLVFYYCISCGFRAFIITSGSMQPALKPGYLVITKPQTRYYVGQIIVYHFKPKPFLNEQKDQLIIVSHRVHSLHAIQEEPIYITKGDSNFQEDLNHVKQSQIIGKIWLSFPLVGFLLAWIYERLGFYPLIVLPAFLIIIIQLLKSLKDS